MSRHVRPLTLILTLLCATQFMLVLDVAVVNVALPSIQRDLAIRAGDLQWVSTAYTLTFGGLLVLAGRAGDLLGKRRVFVGGLALFTLASALCGAAQADWELFVSRGLQGVGAAAVSSAALALLIASFQEGAGRARAIGIFSAVASLGAAAGQLLGGVLTDLVDWRAIFLVNLPIGVAALVLAPRLVAAPPPAGRPRLDWAGAATLTAGLVVLILGLTGTEAGVIDARALVLAGVAVLLLALFAVIERRHPEPLVRFGLFRIRPVAVGNTAMALSAGAVTAALFFATLYLQLVLGYSPLAVAAAFVPITLVIALLSPRAGALAIRLGIRRLLLTGTALATTGALALAAIPEHGSYVVNVLPGLLLLGLGMAAFFAPAMVAATSGVAESDQGLASGAIGTSQQLGGAIGLAIASTVSTAVAEASRSGGDAGLVAGYRAGLLVVAALLVLAAVASAFAPGAEAPEEREAQAACEAVA